MAQDNRSSGDTPQPQRLPEPVADNSAARRGASAVGAGDNARPSPLELAKNNLQEKLGQVRDGVKLAAEKLDPVRHGVQLAVEKLDPVRHGVQLAAEKAKDLGGAGVAKVADQGDNVKRAAAGLAAGAIIVGTPYFQGVENKGKLAELYDNDRNGAHVEKMKGEAAGKVVNLVGELGEQAAKKQGEDLGDARNDRPGVIGPR